MGEMVVGASIYGDPFALTATIGTLFRYVWFKLQNKLLTGQVLRSVQSSGIIFIRFFLYECLLNLKYNIGFLRFKARIF